MNTSPLHSLTGYFLEKASDILLVEHSKDSFGKKYAKLTFGTPSFCLIALLGVIESIVRTLFAYSLSVLSPLVPEKFTNFYQTKILKPTHESASTTFLATTTAASNIITNFLVEKSGT